MNVVVSDANLPEYGEETQVIDGIPNVSCWIPSEAGQVSLLGRWGLHPLKRVFLIFYLVVLHSVLQSLTCAI